MENILLEKIRGMDFLEKKNNFDVDKDIESVLIYGKHYEKPPMITIVLPTYKRIDLIRRAINSVLEQEDFNDYQLLIVDNEPIFDCETELEKMIKEINSDKIIYYRNSENIGLYANWNRGILLAKSEWICVINDDDVLIRNHLKLMTQIIKENPNIDYLSCRHYQMDYRINPNLDVEKVMESVKVNSAPVRKVNYLEYNFGFAALLLGALFKRQCAIDIGGIIPKNHLAGEDYVFVSKMAYYYNLYLCDLELYGYYWGANQSLNFSIWNDSLIYQYYLYKFISNKRPKALRKLYIKRSQLMIIDEVRRFINGTSFINTKCQVDEEYIRKGCKLEKLKYNKFRRKLYTMLCKVFDSTRTHNYIEVPLK